MWRDEQTEKLLHASMHEFALQSYEDAVGKAIETLATSESLSQAEKRQIKLMVLASPHPTAALHKLGDDEYSRAVKFGVDRYDGSTPIRDGAEAIAQKLVEGCVGPYLSHKHVRSILSAAKAETRRYRKGAR